MWAFLIGLLAVGIILMVVGAVLWFIWEIISSLFFES